MSRPLELLKQYSRPLYFVQDEFRRVCAKYGVAIDERYAWD